jgi:uncharacterized YccA/Bax inhibitor family protein
MNTSNPVLTDNVFTRNWSQNETMTINGVAMKTAILLALCVMSSAWVWFQFVKSGMNPAAVQGWMIGGAVGGLVLALVTAFKKEWCAVTAPLYAVVEGFFIGGISSMFEANYPGIVFQACTATFGTLAAMLFLYQSGIVKATDRFKMIVMSATGGIAILYLLSFVLSFFNIPVMSFIWGNGLFGILFSFFVVGVAALNFVLDFDFIEKGAMVGAPKYLEWYGAFALMVTIVWLYVEFLRLISQLRSRN